MGTFVPPTEPTIEHYTEEEDSPYEEVRVSVSNTDDPDMFVNTIRMWTIGLLLTILGAGMNTFFIFRNPYRLIVSYAILWVITSPWVQCFLPSPYSLRSAEEANERRDMCFYPTDSLRFH